MKLRWFFSAISVGILSVGLPACTTEKQGVESESAGPVAVLRRGNGGEPGSLDPALAEDVHAFSVLRDLYEGLVAEAADGSLGPGVATHWEVSGDGLKYRFFLRHDARWSDGTSVTAHDFVRGFRAVLAPESASAYAFLLGSVENARAFSAGELSAEYLGIHAEDARVLEITLDAPAPYFPGILAMPVAFPRHEDHAPGQRRAIDAGELISNGAYRMVARQPGGVIRLERNPEYWDRANVGIEAVDYYPVTDPVVELMMYRAGELDITNTIPPGQLAALQRDRPGEVRVAPSLGLYYIALDLGEAPMNNPDLRIALTKAIDREQLVEIVGRGERPAFGIVPDGVAGYTAHRYAWASQSPSDRKAGAMQAYSDAGYGTDNHPDLTFVYDTGDIHETVAVAIAAMWRDVLGLEVTLDKREWAYFLDTRERHSDWDAMRFSWVGDYNDATTFLDIFSSGSEQNLSGFRDPAYDELLATASSISDRSERAAMLGRAESVLLEQSPVIPLYFYVSKHLVSPRVRGFEASILDVHPSKRLVLIDGI